MRTATILAVLTLAGCATCREHPTACKAVAFAVVAGTVIALDRHHQGEANVRNPINSGRFPPSQISPTAGR